MQVFSRFMISTFLMRSQISQSPERTEEKKKKISDYLHASLSCPSIAALKLVA